MKVLRFAIDACAMFGAYWVGLKAFDTPAGGVLVAAALLLYSLFVYVDAIVEQEVRKP